MDSRRTKYREDMVPTSETHVQNAFRVLYMNQHTVIQDSDDGESGEEPPGTASFFP